jgi:hypothetical protein
MTSSHLSFLARRAFLPAALCCAIVASAPTASAQEALDSAAAREHLTQGYKLKQQGNLKDALPHLVESLRLDPKLKTIINLADCEEKLGMLVEAQSHWLMARDTAGRESEPRIKQEAEQRLSSIQQRMPRLNILLPVGFPADARVFRDEVLLGRVSLGTLLPTNPGEHKIVVRAPGREDWKTSVKLSERDNQAVTVRLGAVSKTPPSPAPDAAGEAPAAATTSGPAATPGPSTFDETRSPAVPQEPPRDAAQGSTGTVQRVLGIVTGGLGLASFAVAGLYWKKAANDIKIEPDGRKLAQDDLLVTNVSLVSGSILVTAGIVLIVTAPSSSSRSASLPKLFQPLVSVGKNSAFLGASGAF